MIISWTLSAQRFRGVTFSGLAPRLGDQFAIYAADLELIGESAENSVEVGFSNKRPEKTGTPKPSESYV